MATEDKQQQNPRQQEVPVSGSAGSESAGKPQTEGTSSVYDDLMEVLAFFRASRLPTATYHGTAQFNLKNDDTGKPEATVTIRVNRDTGKVTTYQGPPPDGKTSCIVEISTKDFMKVYQGASASEITKMCLTGRIHVHWYKFRELQAFASAFDMSTLQWLKFYKSQGLRDKFDELLEVSKGQVRGPDGEIMDVGNLSYEDIGVEPEGDAEAEGAGPGSGSDSESTPESGSDAASEGGLHQATALPAARDEQLVEGTGETKGSGADDQARGPDRKEELTGVENEHESLAVAIEASEVALHSEAAHSEELADTIIPPSAASHPGVNGPASAATESSGPSSRVAPGWLLASLFSSNPYCTMSQLLCPCRFNNPFHPVHPMRKLIAQQPLLVEVLRGQMDAHINPHSDYPLPLWDLMALPESTLQLIERAKRANLHASSLGSQSASISRRPDEQSPEGLAGDKPPREGPWLPPPTDEFEAPDSATINNFRISSSLVASPPTRAETAADSPNAPPTLHLDTPSPASEVSAGIHEPSNATDMPVSANPSHPTSSERLEGAEPASSSSAAPNNFAGSEHNGGVADAGDAANDTVAGALAGSAHDPASPVVAPVVRDATNVGASVGPASETGVDRGSPDPDSGDLPGFGGKGSDSGNALHAWDSDSRSPTQPTVRSKTRDAHPPSLYQSEVNLPITLPPATKSLGHLVQGATGIAPLLPPEMQTRGGQILVAEPVHRDSDSPLQASPSDALKRGLVGEQGTASFRNSLDRNLGDAASDVQPSVDESHSSSDTAGASAQTRPHEEFAEAPRSPSAPFHPLPIGIPAERPWPRPSVPDSCSLPSHICGLDETTSPDLAPLRRAEFGGSFLIWNWLWGSNGVIGPKDARDSIFKSTRFAHDRVVEWAAESMQAGEENECADNQVPMPGPEGPLPGMVTVDSAHSLSLQRVLGDLTSVGSDVDVPFAGNVLYHARQAARRVTARLARLGDEKRFNLSEPRSDAKQPDLNTESAASLQGPSVIPAPPPPSQALSSSFPSSSPSGSPSAPSSSSPSSHRAAFTPSSESAAVSSDSPQTNGASEGESGPTSLPAAAEHTAKKPRRKWPRFRTHAHVPFPRPFTMPNQIQEDSQPAAIEQEAKELASHLVAGSVKLGKDLHQWAEERHQEQTAAETELPDGTDSDGWVGRKPINLAKLIPVFRRLRVEGTDRQNPGNGDGERRG